ncbi:MAG: long-chain-fatty-acid--CoA ligase [Desulfobacteraceae bacterium]|nr:MAG: long-chain-fatty-acid--CoA ligase [Desulfobacteraceae bacterium]
MNIGDWIRKWSQLSPQKVAVIDDGHEFSYKELNQRSNQVANFFLQKGIHKGDRVGVLLYNCHEYIEIYFALAKVGAILVPLNWRMAPPELSHILNDCGATSLFFGEDFLDTALYIRDNVEEVKDYISLGQEDILWAENYQKIQTYPSTEPTGFKEPDSEDPHIILYTSGTTGFPKGAVLSNRKTFFNALNANIFYGLTSLDIFLVSRPLFHSGGLLVDSTPALYKGATVIYKRRFSPQEYLETIEKYNVTIIETSATFLNFMLKECNVSQYNLRLLKSCYTGGERVSTTMLKEYHKIGMPLSQIFGMTETSIVTWLSTDDAVRKIGSVGKPVLHGEVKILNHDMQQVNPGEIGEIMVKGPILMSGYWNEPEITREVMSNGWFYTGDLATIDDEGFIYIVDRQKDMFISGGENVYPAEVEKILLTNPQILDVAVYGVPDEKWGEVGKASIILQDNTGMSAPEVMEFLHGKIGKFKIPKYVEFVDKLPRTATGKIQKYLLIQKFKKEIASKGI